MPRYLIDTNVLVYCFDRTDSEKQVRALECVDRLTRSHTGVLPAQVLSEFSRVAMHKLEPRMTPDDVHQYVEIYERVFNVLPLTAPIVLEAVRGVRDSGFAYFDAQIWAAARLNQVPVVLSEGFQTGATVEGVTFLNPLETDFDLASL